MKQEIYMRSQLKSFSIRSITVCMSVCLISWTHARRSAVHFSIFILCFFFYILDNIQPVNF